MNTLLFLSRLPRTVVIALITLYQHTLSPDHGPLRHLYTYGYCRHEPTCSQYGKQVILERGILIGIPLLFWRLLHCTPWTKPSEEKLRKMARAISS